LAHATHSALAHATHSALTHATHTALTHATHSAGHATAHTLAAHSSLSHSSLTHAAHSALSHSALGYLLTGLIACRAASLIAKALRNPRIVVGHTTTVIDVVRPVPVRDVCAIELIEAAVVDINVPIPPVHASPNRRSGQYARPKSVPATAPTRRIPIERKVIVVRPRSVHDVGIVDRHKVFVRSGGGDLVCVCGRAAGR
jgi:hypothetical protein